MFGHIAWKPYVHIPSRSSIQGFDAFLFVQCCTIANIYVSFVIMASYCEVTVWVCHVLCNNYYLGHGVLCQDSSIPLGSLAMSKWFAMLVQPEQLKLKIWSFGNCSMHSSRALICIVKTCSMTWTQNVHIIHDFHSISSLSRSLSLSLFLSMTSALSWWWQNVLGHESGNPILKSFFPSELSLHLWFLNS